MTGAAVRSESILAELHDLWTTLGDHAESADAGGVLRACAMTLIVASEEREDMGAIGETLAELMPEHPCRAIILRLQGSDEPFLDARVSAQCWLPRGQRRQICSEQIEITASSASLPNVPALLLPLAVPDLPVVVWCRSGNLFHLAGFQAVAALSGKLIVDSAQFQDPRAILSEIRALAASRVVADLAWARLTRWRETIAHIFNLVVCRERRSEFSILRILCSGEPIPAEAYYMAAWLHLALGWTDGQDRITFEPGPALGGDGLRGVVLASDNLTISVEKKSARELTSNVNGLVQQTVLPPSTEASILGEELSIPGRDPIFESVLAAANRLGGAEHVAG